MGRKIVILLGHPGAGKGTQSRAMVRQLDIPHISTGDMLREAVARKTSFGCEAKRSMDAGEMVRDEIVNGIVAERIQQDDCKKGFILDGYPRTVQQAETFRSQIANGDQLFVIEISAESERLTERLVGRLMCSNCGAIYNVQSRIPKRDGICDDCGGKLVRRSDDREDLIRERFRTYQEETYPLVKFYKDLGVYYQVDGMRPIEEVTRDILSIINDPVVAVYDRPRS
ncbi:MAG: adenylate kinase [Acidobacteria bacterium]|nr:MAG: adenylate kinase [Acidobacteriota bacterium]